LTTIDRDACHAEHEKAKAVLGFSWSTTCVCDRLNSPSLCIQG